MTQKSDLLNSIENTIDDIKKRIESYKKVDATLSLITLLETQNYLDSANNALEKGFVKDSCDEIDEKLKYN